MIYFDLIIYFQYEQAGTNPAFFEIFEANLQKIDTLQLLTIIDHLSEEKQEKILLFLIQNIFLKKEDSLYRGNLPATWSGKMMSLVGAPDGKNILNGILDHEGNYVRTKADTHSKLAEDSEVMTEHAAFLEGKEKDITIVMAEVADVFYNLTQLLVLDPGENKYCSYLNDLATIYERDFSDMLQLVIAKYHYRMYQSKNGKNAYKNEDKMVKAILVKKFSYLFFEQQKIRKTIDESSKYCNKIFAKVHTIMLKRMAEHYEGFDQETQRAFKKIAFSHLEFVEILASNAPSLAQELITEMKTIIARIELTLEASCIKPQKPALPQLSISPLQPHQLIETHQ